MLEITIGQASAAGPKPQNEDYFGWAEPSGDERVAKGIVAAVADGVSGCDDGELASRLVIRGLLADYYATPDTWEPALAMQRVIQSLNRWILGQASRKGQTLVTTLSALVLRGQRYGFAHVGDTRIYRLRGSKLECLTRDHVWEKAGMQHVLTRAIGLDVALAVDYQEGDLHVGDTFLLVTDGVWEPLGDKRLHELLHLHQDPERAASAIVEAAIAAPATDNVTALIVRVDQLPSAGLSDQLAAAANWPVPTRLKPGQKIDAFEIQKVLHDSRGSQLYKVIHSESGVPWVLKTLNPLLGEDAQARADLLTEEWLGKRLIDPAFAQVLPLPTSDRNWFYYVMSWHEGHSLQARLNSNHRFNVPEVVSIGCSLAKAMSVMHRLNILHRDIKPDNLHWGDDGRLRVLDLGVASCEGLTSNRGSPGTPSYMAPELFSGQPASWASEVYAAGVTLYHLLTRHYPYGEIEPFQTPRFGDPIPPSRYRPDIPDWLEQLLLKCVARDPAVRIETADELLCVLEKGEIDSVQIRTRSPLSERNPAKLWMLIALASITLNAMLLYVLAVSH